MAADPPFKVAVMSDLHAYDEHEAGARAPSLLRMGAPEDEPTRHPIAGLLFLIDQEGLTADAVICGGDIGDCARPAAIKYAWSQIHRVKDKLGAKSIIATAGNHDVDSRYLYNDDAKGVLQGLVPGFPFANETDNDRFWARNCVVIDQEPCRFAIVNSSAYHGTKDEEFNHGRISEKTVASLKSQLERSVSRPINILVCHHHPHKHEDVESKDYSVMKGGEVLVNMLGSGQFGRWAIVHGHKHHPRIAYGAGAASAPVIFGAGSLCASLFSELQTRARNQFYLLEFPWQAYGDLELEIGATFRAWDWIFAKGWQPAGIESGLPAYGGFGYRKEVTFVARGIAKLMAGVFAGRDYVPWSEIVAEFPQLRFIVPTDFRQVLDRLRADHKLVVLEDRGQPVQISRE